MRPQPGGLRFPDITTDIGNVLCQIADNSHPIRRDGINDQFSGGKESAGTLWEIRPRETYPQE
jgi:hypothetical protein